MSTPLSLKLAEILSERDAHVSQHEHPHAYASEAQKCSRQIGFRLLALTGATPPSLSSQIAFSVGNHLHERIQDAFSQLYPDTWRSEVTWSLAPDDLVTGRADGFYVNEDGESVVVEIKSMNPYTYTRANNRDMPHYEHALQAHLSAFVLGASVIHIVYINKAGKQEEEPLAEWLAEANHELAEIELLRLRSIVEQTQQGILPDRFYDGDTIENPLKQKWPCTWCPWRDQCVQLGEGEHRLAVPKVARTSSTVIHLHRTGDGNLKAV